ncbi:MAG: hypothetical protein IPN79_07535 [Saprospiraceae bacterium]|nr:hypothetical protein [Saprospiraceae bacterium]
MYLLMLCFFVLSYGLEVQSQNPIIIYTKIVQEQCASYEIYDHGDQGTYFDKILENRDDAAFYYIDEDKKEILVQKKWQDNQYLLKYIFVVQKKTYEIIMKTCNEQLSQNKKQLYILQEKIKDKEL